MRKNKTFGAQFRLKSDRSNYYIHMDGLCNPGVGNGDERYNQATFDIDFDPGHPLGGKYEKYDRVFPRIAWFGWLFGFYIDAALITDGQACFNPYFDGRNLERNREGQRRFELLYRIFTQCVNEGVADQSVMEECLTTAVESDTPPLPCTANPFKCVGVYEACQFNSNSFRADYTTYYSSQMYQHIEPNLEEWTELQTQAWHYGYCFDRKQMRFRTYIDWGHPAFPCEQDETVLMEANQKADPLWEHVGISRAEIQDMTLLAEAAGEDPPDLSDLIIADAPNTDDLLPIGVEPECEIY